MKKGKLFIISGPSGTGKGTILKRVLEDNDNIRFSVSMTTRAPREGEVDGVDYFFVDRDAYMKLLDENGFLEHASVYGDVLYGTPKAPVMKWMDEGYNVLLDIDVQGAAQVRENYPDCIGIFILPPSMEELEARIKGRGSETEETLAARLGGAMNEMAHADEYDYKIVNDNLEKAVAEVEHVISINQ